MEEQQHIFGNAYRSLINQIACTEKKHVEDKNSSDSYHQKVVNGINSEHEKTSTMINHNHEKEVSAISEVHKKRITSYEEELRQRESQATKYRQDELNKAKSNRESKTAQLQSHISDNKAKASSCYSTVSDNKAGAEECLSKIEGIARITATAKDFGKLTDSEQSFDSMQRILSDAVQKSTEDYNIVNQSVDELIKVRASNRKMRKIAAVISVILLIIVSLDVFVIYNQKTLNNGYNIAAKNLDDKQFDAVVDQINTLKSKLQFRKYIMPLFFGESTFVRLIGVLGVQYAYKPASEYYLIQREAFYRRGIISYKSEKWSNAINDFALMANNDAMLTELFDNKSKMESEIKKYCKKSGLSEDFISCENKYDQCLYRACKQSISNNLWSEVYKYLNGYSSRRKFISLIMDEMIFGTWNHSERNAKNNSHGSLVINKKAGDNSYGGVFTVNDSRGQWAKQSAYITWNAKVDGIYVDVQCAMMKTNSRNWAADHLTLKVGGRGVTMEGSNRDARGNGGNVTLNKI